ncbi:SMP-30/gluconolactonase/LRE family protein [Noviherbaspirillum massiliense]|uniref:SMP-30/gluconolactonase/LRE family protein n=1 Tax=Noviherbaspirillum massiliense TaxID=1465823 RepID=UPI0002F94073|nr:SMP-30/gluconolactonase/LRE family protein [Noviherbaspirillum massiliense]
MLRKGLAVILVLVVMLAAYLLLAPVPIEPVTWNAPKDAGYAGPYAVNTRLGGLQHISLGQDSGPEHVVIGPGGKLYAAVDGGKILRMNPDGSSAEVWAQTGGRVLGFDFDARGRLIAADAERGLLAVAADKKVEVLADRVMVDGKEDLIRFADAVVVAKEGKIYFTDASRRFGPKEWGGAFNASVLDVLEHAATGRVLVHDPASAKTEVVMGGLSFANGLALSADERSLFVAETGAYRVWKLATDARGLNAKALAEPGEGAGAPARVVLANLPGYPDNLMRGMDGRIWLGFAKPRSAVADKLADKPFLRKVTMRLPKSLWPLPPAYGHVVAFDESGKVVADLQDPSGKYPETTGVTETADRLYIQSLHAPSLGWLPKDAAGLR